jgi:hypothetical protein
VDRRATLFFSPAASPITLTFHLLGGGKAPGAASGAAGLQESNGDESREESSNPVDRGPA